MARFFTRDRAEELLPAVEKLIRDAIFRKSEYERTEAELREVAQKVILSGGMNVDRERIGESKRIREESVKRLEAIFEELGETGVQVKDLDTGLLDFPTLYRGEEVLLCWRLGEDRIEFWHGLSEGFRGRKPIDDEFLQNHRGDMTA